MLFTRATYIGIDPSRGKYAVAFAALDADLKLLALGSSNVEEALAFLGGQRQAIAAINAPAKLSIPKPETAVMDDAADCKDCRLAEREMILAGYDSYETPETLKASKPWMRLGFEIYEHVQRLGYMNTSNQEIPLRYLEAQSGICYHRWIGKGPMHKYSLEGRMQRQIVLRDLRLPVEEPMNFFEEITRYRLLQGELPEDVLQKADELDAMALAYTAWLADQTDNTLDRAGDEKEGFIYYPKNSLAEYRGRY